MTIYALKDGALARFFAVLAILTMIVSLIPMQAFAQDATPIESAPQEIILDETPKDEEGDGNAAKKIQGGDEGDSHDEVNEEDFSTFSTLRFDPKVDICHFPPGNPENVQFLEVSAFAVITHVFHGDFVIEDQEDEDRCQELIDIANGGSITVIKEIVGNDEVKPKDFVFTVGETEVKNGKEKDFAPGTYIVTETPKEGTPTNYTTSFSGDCIGGSITVALGDDLTCTITNDYTPVPTTGTIIVKKEFSDGTDEVPTENFNFIKNQNDAIAFDSDGENVLTEQAPGSYVIVESEEDEYTPSYENCSFELTAGETETCVITNTYDPEPTTHLVHIFKHLKDGEVTEQVADGSGAPMFPMLVTYNIAGVGSGTNEPYVLGDGGGSWGSDNDLDYAANTRPLATGDDYATAENTDGSVVLPIGAQCTEGKYRLVGYKVGDTYEAAVATSTSPVSPSFTDISDDHYVIVVNELCTEVPQEEPVCRIGTNLIDNGSFEDPEVTNDTWEVYANGTSGLEWIVSWVSGFLNAPVIANLEHQENVEGWDAEDGDQYAELDTDWDANVSGEQASVKIAQTIVTEPGATYELRYAFSPRPNTGTTDNALQVAIDGVLSPLVSADGSALNNTSWQTLEEEFVATDASTEISFADAGTPNSVGTLLDNVVVCKVKEAPLCTPELDGSWADDVVSKDQGNRKNGTPVLAARSNEADALGASDWDPGDTDGFYSLGFGGEIVLSFDSFVPNVAGTDIRVHEATNGVYAAETVDVFVSQDGITWVLAGTANNTSVSKITDVDFDATGYAWIKFVKIVDTSNPVAHTADADGFDLDAVEVTQQVCEEPQDPVETATVTMCKLNTQQAPLSNWTLMLKGDEVEEVVVPTNISAGTTTATVLNDGTSYLALASGTWTNQGGANVVDVEYSSTNTWATHMDGYDGYQTDILELQINGAFDPLSIWGAYNSAHQYAQSFVPAADGVANFRIFDGSGTTVNEGWYGDNAGTLNVELYEGYAGVTDQNGCVTFTEVPFGTYSADEIMQDGWVNVSGIATVEVDQETETFNIVNDEEGEPVMCELTIVSNEDDQVGANDAVLVTFIHDAWDAVIGGASWIWSDNPVVDPVGETNKTFTKSFTWSGAEVDIVSATLTIAADNSYDAEINGTSAASSTAENNFGASTVHDVTDLIETGSNQIEVAVKNMALAGGTTETNPAGLLYKLVIVGENANCEEDDDSDDDPTPDETVSSELIVVKAADLETETNRFVADANDSGKWFFYNDEDDTINNTLGSFVSGPAIAPLGTGSVDIDVTGTERRNLATYQFDGIKLADIKTLKFSTYNPSAGNGGSADRSGYLHFNVSFDGLDTWQRRLVFVPSENGAVLQNTWQEWDAINAGTAKWSYSGMTWPTTSQAEVGVSGSVEKTWDEILIDYPMIETRESDSFMGIRVGEPYADGYTENIDKFVIAVETGLNTHTKTFDFEPTSQDTEAEFNLVITTTGEGEGLIIGTGINCDTNVESDCSESYPSGTVVNLTVTPDEGSNFDNSWSVGAGSCTGNATPCAVTMTSDVNLTAHFDLDEDDDDDDSSSTNRGGGGRVSLTDDEDEDDDFGFGGDDSDLPEGRVLGEQTSAYPYGAPNTGAGGAAQSHSTESIFALIAAFFAAVFARKMQNN